MAKCEGRFFMAKQLAKTVTGFTWRCIAIAFGLALLTYGHQALSDTGIFGVYAALCLFAIAIVFYLTTPLADVRRGGGNDQHGFNTVSAYRHMNQLSTELAKLEDEYRTDITRLERKWL